MRFVFDGMVHPLKHETVLSRLRENARRVNGYLAQMRLRHGEPLEHSGFVLPLGVMDCLCEAVRGEGVACRRALYEADAELAAEYHAWSAKGAIGVLSNDSDLLCMRVPMVPMNEIRLDAGGFRAIVYEPATVAERLGIQPYMLPMLSCMAGNDYISRHALSAFHLKLVPSSGSHASWKVLRNIGARLAELAAMPQSLWEHGIDPPLHTERLCVREMFAEQLQVASTAVPGRTAANKGKTERQTGAGERDTEDAAAARVDRILEEWIEEVRRARAAYHVHARCEPERGGVGEGWWQLAEEMREMRLDVCVLQLAVHREVWCRVAIECLAPEDRVHGAHQRAAPLRRCLAQLVLCGGKDGGEGDGDHGDEGSEFSAQAEVAGNSAEAACENLQKGDAVVTEFVQFGADVRRRSLPLRDEQPAATLPRLPMSGVDDTDAGDRGGMPPLSTSACCGVAHYRQFEQGSRRRALVHLVVCRDAIGVSDASPADPAVAEEELRRVRQTMLGIDPADLILSCALFLLVAHARVASVSAPPDAVEAGQGRGGRRSRPTGGRGRTGKRFGMTHTQVSALAAAVTFPQEAYRAWMDAAVAREGEEEGANSVVFENLNMCACLRVLLQWLNAINDALARPFPPQSVAVTSPRLLRALQCAPGGVAGAINRIWPSDACPTEYVAVSRARWLHRWGLLTDLVWTSLGAPTLLQQPQSPVASGGAPPVPSKMPKRAKQSDKDRERRQRGAQGQEKKGTNMFDVLMSHDSDD